MAAIQLEAATVDALDQIVAGGRFNSREEAIVTALQIVRHVDSGDGKPFDPETLAAIEEGIADAEAGRLIPAEQVFAELRHRYRNWR